MTNTSKPLIDNNNGTQTPQPIRHAVQELMRWGVIEAAKKSELHRVLIAHQEKVAHILEPLDLTMLVDDVRGIVVLAVPKAIQAQTDGSEPDIWTHPLVRRQRLTLDQSLLIVLLRRHYINHEQNSSTTSGAKVAVDDLITELQPYLGERGSETEELTRVQRLLKQLKEHGLVSAVENDEVTVRPLICHLADVESLQGLLAHYTSVAGGDTTSRPARYNPEENSSVSADATHQGSIS